MIEILTAFVALFFFGTTLVFYDLWRKQVAISDRIGRVADQFNDQCSRLREVAAHWCNETIRAEKTIEKERAERKRWERAYAESLREWFN